jgi:hypothetical protein
MQQTFTPELLVKHLYNETTPSEASAINHALANDTNLQQEFKQLQETKNALDEADGEAPGAYVIQKILAFSKKQELTESH